MGTKILTLLFCLAVLMAAGAVGAYALDSSKADEIAEGVRAGGIDLGGLERDEAARLLREELVAPARRPIEVRYEDKRFVLEPSELEVHADIRGMVDEALAVSRQGDLPTRVLRHLTEDEVEHAIPAEVAFSRTAVERFVSELARTIDREPANATIEPTGTELTTVSGRSGRALDIEKLRAQIVEVLENGGRRTIQADVGVIEPEVAVGDLAAENPDYIVVDRASFTLRHYEDLKLAKEYTVAIGQEGYDTPAGLYAIQSMQVDPIWYVPDAEWAGELAGTTVPPGPDNPLKARWMGFNGGAGIHGTADEASLGSAASHGCVRMAVEDVKELYELVSVGTPVYIA